VIQQSKKSQVDEIIKWKVGKWNVAQLAILGWNEMNKKKKEYNWLLIIRLR